MENEKNKSWQNELCEQVDSQIKDIINESITTDNIDYLGELIDIKKDLKEMEDNKMMYRTGRMYGNDSYNNSYGRRGRYNEGNRYRGNEMLDEMSYHYGNYSDGKEMYGNDSSTMESFKYMLKAFKDYYKHLKQEASSQEEVRMLEETAREIGMM